MRIGICQTDIFFQDKGNNIMKARDMVAGCAKAGAEVVFFPEMSMTGFTMKPEEYYEENMGTTYCAMKRLAEEYKVHIGYGYISNKNDGFYNTYDVINPKGDIVNSYDKIHPFSYSGEDEHYKKGNKISCFEINGVRICTLICYDLRFSELFIKAAPKADLITVAANFGGPRDNHWKILLQARAIENQLYIAGINRTGEDISTYYMGHSMVISPKGDIIELLDENEGCIVTDIEPKAVAEYREKFPVAKDRRPEIYSKL